MGTDELSAFDVTAPYEQRKLEIYQELFDRYVGEPLAILWDDYRGRFGLLIVSLYVLMGTVGVTLVPAPSTNMGPRMIQPFTDPRFPLGTDGLGQGLLSLMVHATPDMLKMILAGAVFSNCLGVSIGLYTGYVGGTKDKAIMTVVDTLNSIPGIPLLIILAALLEPTNPFLIGIILSIQRWTGTVRTIRSQVIPLANQEHVEASRALGESKSALLVTEILPHLLPYVFIGFLGGATYIVFASVGLYFLGILPFSTQNWGIVLNFAYERSGALYSLQAAHWLVVPLVTIVGLNVGLTMLAQAFDQVFNPRVRARHNAREQSAEPAREQSAKPSSDGSSTTTRSDTPFDR